VSYGTDPEGADLRVSALVEPSHEEPIGQLAARDRQVAAMAGQLAELV